MLEVPVPGRAPHERGAPPLLGRRGLLLGAGAAVAVGAVAGPVVTDLPAAAAATTTSGVDRLTLSSQGIVQRRGAPFRAGGVNAFHLVTNDYPRPHLMSTSQVDALLRRAALLDVRIVRAHTLGASVGMPFTLVRGVSGQGPSPRIVYDPAVWRIIDYAVWRARSLGLYLVPPLVDELGYYHGGKRHWVEFRRPGSVSLDPATKAANSSRQRAAENAFYHDRQIGWDFDQYVRDWLGHVNQFTGVANKDEPVLSIVQVGNELWTAAQDAVGWVDAKAALIKSVAPEVLVMDSGADGLRVEDMAWASRHVDVLETHPYSTFGPADVTRMARFAATKGKAFAVGEYAWSKSTAPALEAAVRTSPNVFTSAPWSLHDHPDLHNAGAGYGIDDAALYVPGKDATQRDAVARIRSHHAALLRPLTPARTPAPPATPPAARPAAPPRRRPTRRRRRRRIVRRRRRGR